MPEENMSQEFRLKILHETINYSIEKRRRIDELVNK